MNLKLSILHFRDTCFISRTEISHNFGGVKCDGGNYFFRKICGEQGGFIPFFWFANSWQPVSKLPYHFYVFYPILIVGVTFSNEAQ